MIGTQGLKAVSSDDLKLILRLVYRGALKCPIDQPGLAMAGLLRIADELDAIRGLEQRAVMAVITAVLAERQR